MKNVDENNGKLQFINLLYYLYLIYSVISDEYLIQTYNLLIL